MLGCREAFPGMAGAHPKPSSSLPTCSTQNTVDGAVGVGAPHRSRALSSTPRSLKSESSFGSRSLRSSWVDNDKPQH